MATISLTLPEDLQSFVDRQVASGSWTDGADYVRDLVRRDEERHALRGLLLQGSRSPMGSVVDDRYLGDLRARASGAR